MDDDDRYSIREFVETTIQMRFDGQGFVVAQPFEERPLQAEGTGG